jgi:hypothetical protein
LFSICLFKDFYFLYFESGTPSDHSDL